MTAPPLPKLDLPTLISRGHKNDLILSLFGILALIVGLGMLTSLIINFLVDGGLRLDWDFLTKKGSARAHRAGIAVELITTSLVMVVTALLAIPLGIASGVYLEEYAKKNRLTDIIEINISNLAGVPSIIYGLLGLGIIQLVGLKAGVLVGGATLALLILPIIIVATRESIRAIPQNIREGAYGLGADQWQMIWLFVLPGARSGIITGSIIGLSRAIGETAPLITIGAALFNTRFPPSPLSTEIPYIDFSWLFAPITVLPLRIYDWTTRPQASFLENAAAATIVLLAITFIMNGIAMFIRYRLRKNTNA